MSTIRLNHLSCTIQYHVYNIRKINNSVFVRIELGKVKLPVRFNCLTERELNYLRVCCFRDNLYLYKLSDSECVLAGDFGHLSSNSRIYRLIRRDITSYNTHFAPNREE